MKTQENITWTDKGKYLETLGPLGIYRVINLYGRWILTISYEVGSIPEQILFDSKEEAIN